MTPTNDLFNLAYVALIALRPMGVGVVRVVKGRCPGIFSPPDAREYDQWAQFVDPTMPPKRKTIWVLGEVA